MKYIKLWLVILFLGLLGTASAQITFFEGTFEDAMAKAKKEKKNLFVDFYADWCEPCKLMGTVFCAGRNHAGAGPRDWPAACR